MTESQQDSELTRTAPPRRPGDDDKSRTDAATLRDPIAEREALAELEELAELERQVELELFAPLLRSAHDERRAEHRLRYDRLEQLAGPLRDAVGDMLPPSGELVESSPAGRPPGLHEYGELEEIGRGGMGIVYRARHLQTQRVDAIKVMRADRLVGLSAAEVQHRLTRFRQEWRLAASVSHAHIVPIYQVGETEGHPWYSMQWVDGWNLRELQRRGELSAERVVGYLEQVCRALDVVHRRGIRHGDIKPHNILVDRESDRPLLTDFGLAELEDETAARQRTVVRELSGRGAAGRGDGVVCGGTAGYLAPELTQPLERALAGQGEAEAGGSSPAVPRSRSVAADVYALGATLWTLLVGEPPAGPVPSTAPPRSGDTPPLATFPAARTIPRPLLVICQRCLAVRPADRFASAAELADALQAWLARPRWNRYFPRLRTLLWAVVAPSLIASGVAVQWLVAGGAAGGWVWAALFAGYLPLFATLLLATVGGDRSAARKPSATAAGRELWSIWAGHASGSLACLASCQIIYQGELRPALEVFYPCCAALSAAAFFAKSGNFWGGYRGVGAGWALAAPLLAAYPTPSPLIFSALAALTCLVIAVGDREWSARP